MYFFIQALVRHPIYTIIERIANYNWTPCITPKLYSLSKIFPVYPYFQKIPKKFTEFSQTESVFPICPDFLKHILYFRIFFFAPAPRENFFRHPWFGPRIKIHGKIHSRLRDFCHKITRGIPQMNKNFLALFTDGMHPLASIYLYIFLKLSRVCAKFF